LIECSNAVMSTAIAQLDARADAVQKRIDAIRDRVLVYGSLARLAEESDRVVELADCLLQRREPDVRRARAAGFAAYVALIEREFHGETDAKLLLSVGAAYVAALSVRGFLDVALSVDVPTMAAMLRRSAELAPKLDGAHALILLGALDCARPIAVGGQPREGLSELERAAQLTEGHHLTVQLTMAVRCAVTLNERQLFDRLLRAVIDADSGTAFARENALAKQRARYLLSHADLMFPD
jgi:hypothetical protein